ncbi:MAG: ribose-5-phosphate isomerase RpiA [Deltaproteobacteria bacterium]|nr:ribose-5-phosphate isomerase RpiA [Deltaproteobacteria bacterium]
MTLVLDAVAHSALAMVRDGSTVGLGTGRAAAAFIAALGARMRQGFVVTGVPTSLAAAQLARAAGIPLAQLQEGHQLDLTVDGADEVAPNLDLLKGRGGALVRERIVAAASKRQVILVGHDKLVHALGAREDVPVEIIPMAAPLVTDRLRLLGVRPTLRMSADGTAPFVTENGNLTLDCRLPGPLVGGAAARQMEAALRSIPGVVDTGFFLGTAERVLVGYSDGRVDVLVRRDQDGEA